MAAEPINIFSHKIDPRGVLALLRSMAPSLQVVGPEDCWEKIVIFGPKRLFRKSSSFTFGHDPEYYDGPDWPMQVFGMQNYFRGFPKTPRQPEIVQVIGSFRFSLSTDWDPELNADDDRLNYVFAVAKHLDGVIFMPSSLRDAEGRVLIGADGEFDADAVLPRLPSGAEAAPMPSSSEDQIEDAEPTPPTPSRVARRALALTAVAARALLEQEDPTDPMVEVKRQELLAWLSALDINDELEPDEWKVLQRPVGKLDQQSAINATWRLEGLGVLAWALGRFDLPPYDQLVDPGALLKSLGVLDAESARALLQAPAVRPEHELQALHTQLLAVHWRLRDFTIRPQAMDFKKFSREGWMGAFDLAPFRLIDDDLALGNRPVSKASKDVFGAAISSAMERHLAMNWLHGYSEIYSDTDTST